MSTSTRAAPAYLAFDLGAASGRAILGRRVERRLVLEELHRFPNGGVRLPSGLHWDVLRIWEEMQQGLAQAADACGDRLQSVAVDTWGVDFALLAGDDALLGNPYHYRDSRTDGILERAFARMPAAEIYRRTGVQMMQINSLFQLLAMVETGSPLLEVAGRFLNMPDLFNFWLSGRKANEFTIATTTQCYSPLAGEWDHELLAAMSVPSHLFGEMIAPTTPLDTLRDAVRAETGAPPLTVVAAAGHDTACAVAAVPGTGPDFIFLSSGTWSLMGIEVTAPIITEASQQAQVTNEGSVGNTYRFLKNIMGMWLLQECRRTWQQQGAALSYAELTALAAEAPAFGSFIVPDDPGFLPPGDMPARIQSFCAQTGQTVPQSRGEIVRCVLESLALTYREVADHLAQLSGRVLPVIHIIGGGSQNRLLNQFTADATGRAVVAGPVEATAAGNVLLQMMAMGELDSVAEGRALVRHSFDLESYEPGNGDGWEAAYARFRLLPRIEYESE